ncbi:hypothetical protein BD779DRAFT_1515040 [Infundibulicybe gibba]|nr:hypothetical protein BD779DRAFT_1515040 [Infundibulicybe gibba]
MTEGRATFFVVLLALLDVPEHRRAAEETLNTHLKIAKYRYQHRQTRMFSGTSYFVRPRINRWRRHHPVRKYIYTKLYRNIPTPCPTTPTTATDRPAPPQRRHSTTPLPTSSHLSQKLLDKFILVISSIHNLLLFKLPQIYHSRICTALEVSPCRPPDPVKPLGARAVQARCTISQRSVPRSFVEEWKALRDLSGLIIGAVLAVLQIPNVANHPVTRTATFMCLLFTVMGGMYSSMLILHFLDSEIDISSSTKLQDLLEPQNCHSIWNIWVMLSLPTIWIYWGVFYFLLSVVFLVWGSTAPGVHGDTNSMSGALGPRLSLILRLPMMGIALLGFIYLIATILTLRRMSAQARRVVNPV